MFAEQSCQHSAVYKGTFRRNRYILVDLSHTIYFHQLGGVMVCEFPNMGFDGILPDTYTEPTIRFKSK